MCWCWTKKLQCMFVSLWKPFTERKNWINHTATWVLARESMCVTWTYFTGFFSLHSNHSLTLKTRIQIQYARLSHAPPGEFCQADTAWWLIAIGHRLLKAKYIKSMLGLRHNPLAAHRAFSQKTRCYYSSFSNRIQPVTVYERPIHHHISSICP